MKIRAINFIARNCAAAVVAILYIYIHTYILYYVYRRKSGATIIIEYLSGRKQLNATVAAVSVGGGVVRQRIYIYMYMATVATASIFIIPISNATATATTDDETDDGGVKSAGTSNTAAAVQSFLSDNYFAQKYGS